MNINQIVQEYFVCKTRIEISKVELGKLGGTPDFIKVTKYGQDSNGSNQTIEDIHLKLLDKRRSLEIRITMDKSFTAKIDYALSIAKREFDKIDYEAFYLKHFKNQKLKYIAQKLNAGCPGHMNNRILKIEAWFERVITIN